MNILGIDLGKFKSVCCMLNTDGNQTEYYSADTSREYLRSMLSGASLRLKLRADLVVIEACAISGWVHDLCVEVGVPCLVVSPNEEAWRWKSVKRKTDKADALKLAKLTALEQVTPVHVPDRAGRQYRSLVKYRKTLQQRINRIQNSLRSLFLMQGIPIPCGAKAWTEEGLAKLASYRQPLGECVSGEEFWRGQVDLEMTAMEQTSELLQEVEQKLEEIAQRDPRVQLLMTIPGVGRKTAEMIAAYLDDPRRFQNGRQVSAFAGLVPRRFQSGEMDLHGRINKRGPRLLRAALVEACWCALRYNPWARETYERIKGGQKTRSKQAIVALARKLLVRAWAMLRDNRPWQADAPGERSDAQEMGQVSSP
jgi:transposase